MIMLIEKFTILLHHSQPAYYQWSPWPDNQEIC